MLSLITAQECNQAKFYAIYLTNWNVVMNAFSSVFGATLVTLFYRKTIAFEVNQEIPKFMKIFWLFSTLSTVVSTSLACVYWPLIYNGRDKGLNDSLTHAGNSIVMLFDIFVNAIPARFGHFIYPFSFGAIYAFVFSLPYTLLGGTDRDLKNFIYSVLDWKDNTSGAFTFASATIIFLTIMHFVLTFFACSRIYLYNWLRKKHTVDQRSDFVENNRQNENLSIDP